MTRKSGAIGIKRSERKFKKKSKNRGRNFLNEAFNENIRNM